MGNVVGTSLDFSKNLMQVILLKPVQKAAKNFILLRIMQRVYELTALSNTTFILQYCHFIIIIITGQSAQLVRPGGESYKN